MTHECVTHHHACNCREAEHQFQIESKNRIIAELEERLAAAQKAHQRAVDACYEAESAIVTQVGADYNDVLHGAVTACRNAIANRENYTAALAKERKAGRDEYQNELSNQTPCCWITVGGTIWNTKVLKDDTPLIVRPQPPEA